MLRILELGAGRDWQTNWLNHEYPDDIITCVDASYDDDIQAEVPLEQNLHLIRSDITSYLEQYNGPKFDKIFASRVMEHIPYDQLHYLTYLLHKVCVDNGELIISVPDYEKISELISTLDHKRMKADEFNLGLIKTHTEVFNGLFDPHQSIWTQKLASYYLELEGYWEINCMEHITIEKRDWYIEIVAKHVGNSDVVNA